MFKFLLSTVLNLSFCSAWADATFEIRCLDRNGVRAEVHINQLEDYSATAFLKVFAFPMPGKNNCVGSWEPTQDGKTTSLTCQDSFGWSRKFEIRITEEGELIRYFDKNTRQTLPCVL
jgi:hypothetical protein